MRNLALKHYSAEPVLTLTCFSFGDNYYKQANGVAMGTKMGPSYANLFVDFIEHQFFRQINGPKPGLYGRLIDDCIGATFSTREELIQIITVANSSNPALKYTWEISDIFFTFLHNKVSTEGNGQYYKPTDSTDSQSLVVFIFTSIIHQEFCSFSRFLRFLFLCSDGSDFSDNSEAMYQFFDKRGYPVSVVKAGHHRAQQIDRQSALQTAQKVDADRTLFTLTTTRWNSSF